MSEQRLALCSVAGEMLKACMRARLDVYLCPEPTDQVPRIVALQISESSNRQARWRFESTVPVCNFTDDWLANEIERALCLYERHKHSGAHAMSQPESGKEKYCESCGKLLEGVDRKTGICAQCASLDRIEREMEFWDNENEFDYHGDQ